MQRYLCIHTFGPGSMTRQQVEQFSQIAQQAQEVRGVHSYVNLSEGKAACIFEAQSKATLDQFFKKNRMPVDSITAIEIEGDQGIMQDTQQAASSGADVAPM